MIILGIHDGHNASAALTIDGNLIYALAEERLSRKKHHYGFPSTAIDYLLKQANIKISDIDRIAMSTKTLPPSYFYTSRNEKFSISDYWMEQNEYWYPKLYEGKNPKYLEIFSKYVDLKNFPYDNSLIKDENDHEGMWKARIKHLKDKLKINSDIISVHDHHDCHAYYGYIANSQRLTESVLVYTMDGGGDGVNGTVSIGHPGKPLKFISRSSNCNIGRLYRYMTLLLGMRPADHEYKLMGLSAYNVGNFAKKAYEIFAETLQVDGLGFKYKSEVKDHFFHFKNKLEGERFDSIAYGIQKRTEELLTEWIYNGIKQTGIGNIVMSGGVSQNIKANKCIWQMSQVKQLFIPPGPGDESISIGAAYAESIKQGHDINHIKPLSTAYFGLSYDELYISNVIKNIDNKNWIVRKVTSDEIAALLAKGDIVAHFGLNNGEFGARALGSRSIIADPRRADIIHHINKLVKVRDFWMPFAPSILEEREKDYIINPKKIDARFMAIGFDSTALAQEHLPAGLHPFDRTARPQIVNKNTNAKYYEIIKAFEKLTGVGALLNTSFNIHGEPIVGTPEQAIDTFERCGLHHLVLGTWIISKAKTDNFGN